MNVSIFSSRGMKEHHVSANDVASFLVSDPITGASARGDYVQTLVGVMRPKLDWRTEALGSSELEIDETLLVQSRS